MCKASAEIASDGISTDACAPLGVEADSLAAIAMYAAWCIRKDESGVQVPPTVMTCCY